MFFRKKKPVEKKHVENRQQEVFEIPQIIDDTVGLRLNKKSFRNTPALSPMTGRNVTDKVSYIETEHDHDINVAYGPFFDNNKLTEEDEIRIYGRKYHEFVSIDDLNEDIGNYEPKPEESPLEKKEEIGIGFGVVLPADDIEQKESFKPFVMQENYSEAKEVNNSVVFEKINVSQEIKDDVASEPTFDKVPDYLKVDIPISNEVDDNIPKTIISHNPRGNFDTSYEEDYYEPMPKVEPVVRVFEAPEVSKESTAYEKIKEEQSTFNEPIKEIKVEEPKKVIYVDKYSKYVCPSLSLLEPASPASLELPSWLDDKKELINNTMADFGVDGQVEKYTYGPTVTRYEVKLASGVNVKKISQIEDNLKMSLCAKTIRIEAPIPGKSNVGIEVPNEKVRKVNLIEIVDREEFMASPKKLLISIGLDIDGKPIYSDINKMPHGLIAGGTGSGKSVFINSLLISLLLRNSPDDVKFIMIDPKQVELLPYSDIPHLVTPVINDPKLASEGLKWACEEMDRRYKAFAALRVRDFASYNSRIANDPSYRKLPYLVIVIDELADLMMTCGNDVEASIQRITQLGRAAGIHCIVATQRPTTDIVRGTIKTNIQTRIAFKVPQFVDSNTILDQAGAENLLGYGDMLIKEADLPMRVQGAFISDDEIGRICDFIRNNYEPDYIFTHDELANKIKSEYGANGSASQIDKDLLYEIASHVISRGSCSINNIQNSFSLGFNRAQSYVNALEDMGLVEKGKGTTGRQILMTQAEIDEMFKKGA